MSVKTIVWVVALVIGAALLIVVGSAILACLRAGRHRDDEVSSNQSVPLSEFPRVSSTTFYLDGDGFPTGAVSTSSTSTQQSDFVAPIDTGYVSRVIGGHGLKGVEKTKLREPHPDIEEGSVSLVNLQVQILGVHAEVDVSRRSSTKRKTREVGKSHCA